MGNTTTKGPGRAYRQGISTVELFRMFPDDKAAEKWFEEQRWPTGERDCPECGSLATAPSTHPSMKYRCRSCRTFFSVRKGTVMEGSNVGFQKWAMSLYLVTTSLKGISSMKLHRELGVTQKTAWHLMHRIRESFDKDPDPRFRFPGPVEIDEAYFGGKESNKHKDKKLNAGRGTVGKQAVVSVRDRESKEVRAKLVPDTKADTRQGEVGKHVQPDAVKFTDEHAAYDGLQNHQTVSHGTGEYVRGMAHVNGCESFWATLKRGYHGTFHRLSFKHLQRYVNEFSGRHNILDKDILEQMCLLARALVGKRLRYQDLIA